MSESHPDRGVAAVVLAGGKGNRLQSIANDKILLSLAGHAIICWSLAAFVKAGWLNPLVIVYRDESQKQQIEAEILRSFSTSMPDLMWVQGGAQRQHSVANALEVLDDAVDIVFVHDGARPFVTPTDLNNLKSIMDTAACATMAKPVTDTIKRANKGGDSFAELVLEDLDRSRLFAMQTPQVFKRKELLEAYRRLNADGVVVTDCVEARKRLETVPCAVVFAEQNNLKITRPEDVELASFLIDRGSIKNVIEFSKAQ